MIDFQNLTNLAEINFKSKDKPGLKELADYIDHMKRDLFADKWSQATKKHIKTSLVLYIRSMQKQLAPMGYHYKAQNIEGKQHLEHVIPQNKIVTAKWNFFNLFEFKNTGLFDRTYTSENNFSS